MTGPAIFDRQMPPMSLLSDNGMPGSPSAIQSMLQALSAPPPTGPASTPGPSGGLLAPGTPAPAQAGPPQASQMGGSALPAPQAAPLPPTQNPPTHGGMLDRIHAWLLKNVPGMQAPDGYAGLLSPDEIQHARPSLLKAFIGGPDAASPAAQYRENLNNVLGMKQIAAQIAEQQRIKGAIATMPRLQENATEDQFKTWAQKAYAHAIENNLPEDIKSKFANIVTESIKAPKADATKVVAPGGALVDSTGKPLYTAPAAEKAPLPGTPGWKAAEEFKASLAAKYRVDPTQIIQGADESGTMHFYRVPKNGGAPEMIDGMTPKVTVKSESAQQELTRARAEAAVSEMNNGTKFMQQFEERLKRGEVKIGNAGQILGSMANTFTHDDPASKAIQNSALTVLNKTNPDLARYIRRALSFAEAESMVSSRPSDFRTRMSAFLSQAANGATPEMIDDIASRRNSIMSPLNRIYAQAASEGQGGPHAPTTPVSAPAGAKRAITKDQADFLRTKKGMTPAQIAAQFTVTP